MSLNRFATAQRVVASSKKVVPYFRYSVRLRNNLSSGGRFSGLKIFLYGLSTTGLVVGGSLAYGNYDPSFRYKVDAYIPGFAHLVDRAADKWVEVVDAIQPRSSDKVGLKADYVPSESRKPTLKQSDTKAVSPRSEIGQSQSDPAQTCKEVEPLQKSDTKPETQPVIPSPQPSANKVSPSTPSADVSVADTTDEESGKASILSGHVLQRDEVKIESSQIDAKEPQLNLSPIPASQETPDAVVENSSMAVKENLSSATIDVNAEQSLPEGLDTAQVEMAMYELYEKYCELDKRTYDLCRVLIQSEKERQHIFTQAMQNKTDDVSVMQSLADGMTKANEEVQAAEKSFVASQVETSKVARELGMLLDKALKLGLKSKVEEMRSALSQLHIRAMMDALDYEETKVDGKVMEEYKHAMEKVKDWISSEMGKSLPELESQEEVMVLMLTERLKALTLKVEELEEDYRGQLSAALLKQREELEELFERKTQLRLQEQNQEIWDEAQKKLNRAVQKREEELKEQLYIQTEAHSQHLSEALQSQAEQLDARWAKQLDLKLNEQESYYQVELAKALARLQGIEAVIDTIANAGVQIHQQQSLRTACDTLCAALEQADIKVDPYERYSFTKEIASLREAAHEDGFILAVLDCIPKEAVNSLGIQSEAGLHQRFKKVKQICKKVALVPQIGGGLGTYALSYLHSLLAIDVWKRSSSAYLQKYPTDMDTFELLQHADHLLQCGQLEGAIRVLHCLQGESKRVASDWLKDARLYIETKQAVSVVQTYLAGINLSFTQ